MAKNRKISKSVTQRLLHYKTLNLVRQTVDEIVPKIDNKEEKVWQIELTDFGENYGMGKYLDGITSQQEVHDSFIKEAFGEKSLDFFLEPAEHVEDIPPKIILRIHFLKKN